MRVQSRHADRVHTVHTPHRIDGSLQTTTPTDSVRPWGNQFKTLSIPRRDQVWVGDITYVRLNRRFISVALLMDIFTRMISGWQVSEHLNTSLTLKPLQQALFQSGSPEIHHSDQGVQYLSTAYMSRLKQRGIQISLARSGCPWENGYAQRLIRTLKAEEVHLNAYKDVMEARERIGHFLTQVYQQKRPHSALGYLTPVEFQRQTLS